MSVLVGDERRQILADLANHYDSVVADSRPHLVTLVAEAGWGKTRLVQELYGWLQRERQPDGLYWPAELTVPGTDPMRNRKVIYPEQAVGFPDQAMPWLWWGLRCEQDSGGRRLRALLNDGVQLHAHLGELIAAAERRAGDREMAMTVLGEALAFIPGIGPIASVAIATHSLAPKLRARLFDAFKAVRSRQSVEQEPRVVDAVRQSSQEITALVELIRRSISPELPLVLAIDDAHEADPATVEFVGALMALDVPALIVATAWPASLEDQADEEVELEADGPTTFGGLLARLAEAEPNRVSRFDLVPLSAKALGEMVDSVAPHTSDERRVALVEASGGNPLVLGLNVTSPKVSRSIEDGAITLSVEELSQLPRGYERLIGERYEDLLEFDRAWLCEAALQGSEFLPDWMTHDRDGLDLECIGAFARIPKTADTSTVARFIELPVHRVIAAEAEQGFSAEERDAWRRATLTALQEDTPAGAEAERVGWRLLVRLGEDLADTDLVDPLRVADAAYRLSFVERVAEHHDEELRLSEAALGWVRKGPPDAETEALYLARAASAMRALNQRRRAVETAREGAALIEAVDSPDVDSVIDVFYVLAESLRQNGELEEALEVAERLCDAAETDAQRITGLETVATVAGEGSADVERARQALEEAIAIASAQDPPNVEGIISLEMDITGLETLAGSVERWREHRQAVEERLGRDDELFVVSWVMVIVELLMAGDLEEAVRERQGLEREVPSLTEEDLEAVVSFQTLLEHGHSTAAAEMMSSLAAAPYSSEDESGRLGAIGTALGSGDHTDSTAPGPYQLMARAETNVDGALFWLLEEIRYRSEDWAGEDVCFAISAGVGLLHRRLVEHASHSPASDALLGQIEVLAERVPQPELVVRNIDLYRDSLRARGGRALPQPGPGVPHVFQLQALGSRAAGATAGGHRGTAARYLEEARAAIEDADSVDLWEGLARCHDACGSRGAAGAWSAAAERAPDEARRWSLHYYAVVRLHNEGRYAEAIPLARQVLDGRLESQDADAPEVRSARLALAEALISSGQAAEAEEIFRLVLASHERLFGPRDPQTISVRERLVSALFKLGHLEQADAEQAGVVDALAEQLGSDEPTAVRARREQARLKVHLNDLEAADVVREEVIATLLRVYGDEYGLTVEVSGELADSLVARGSYERALPFRQSILAALEWKGPDDGECRAAKAKLAQVLAGLDEHTAATAILGEVVDSRRRTLGETHPWTLEAMESLAISRASDGDIEGAVELQEQILAARQSSANQAQTALAAASEALESTRAQPRK